MYEKNKKGNPRIDVLKFKASPTQKPTESLNVSDDQMVKYGPTNQYPKFLLELYNASPIHSAIINSKVTYIIGDGLKTRDGKAIDLMVNPSETFNDFLGKIVRDYLIFNYFAVEVVFNALNEPIQFYFVPANKIRTNKLKTKFWFSEDFSVNKDVRIFDRWKPTNSDSTSKIFFFDGYFPSLSSVYPTPEYSGCIKSVQTDIAIRDFNYNNIKNHFSVSTLIEFFNGGNIQDEVKEQILRDIEASYTGEDGKKIIVNFQSANGTPAQIHNISAGDWDKAYAETIKNTSDDIYRGHQVTSPMLFGVKTEGQLGGTTELEVAYEIFKNTYIRGKRNELTAALNLLFTGFAQISSALEFTDKPLFNTGLSETLKEKVYTINELRKEAGLPALPKGDRLLSDSPIEQQVNPISQDNITSDTPNPDIKKKPELNLKQLKEEDFDKVAHLGSIKDEFELVQQGRYVFSNDDAIQIQLDFDLDKEISNWILSNNISGKNVDQISELLNRADIKADNETVKSTLKQLNESGLLKVVINDGKVSVTEGRTKLPDTDQVFVMYDYVKRASAEGPEILPTSRSFCKKLISNNRFYSMEDIQSMSAIFGYNIFDYGGGYWHNPSTDETTSHCRHRFRSVVVKKKNRTN